MAEINDNKIASSCQPSHGESEMMRLDIFFDDISPPLNSLLLFSYTLDYITERQ